MRIFIFLFVFSTISVFASNKPAYILYNSKGKKVKYAQLVKKASKTNIVLFGEYHNNPIAHWLQLSLIKDLHAIKKLTIGAEMLEADNQKVLNSYLAGNISQKELDTLARLWSNYKTDYAPVVDFAKLQKIPFIATNIPRKYASLVHKKDFAALDSLSADEKRWIAPLPIPFDSTLATYRNILTMMGGHGSLNLVKAQAIKDATMAYFISQNFVENTVFIHLNGAYHSDFYEGIGWYLTQYAPQLDKITISTVSQEKTNKLEIENMGKADFIIVVDQDMTTTY